MTNGNTDLPKGWVIAPITDILAALEDGRTIHQGWSPRCEQDPSTSGEQWAVLKTTAIQDGAFYPEYNKRLPSHLKPRPLLEVKQGDVLITCAGPRARCGVPCLVRSTWPCLMLSGKMYRFRFLEEYTNPAYMELALRSGESQATIDKMKTGGSDSGLNLTHDRFRPLPLRIPPLPEQHRIVAKVEELFSDLDAGEDALKKTKALLKRYRQSVLKAAFAGKLTAKWREANRGKLEPASVLLERIREERKKAGGKSAKELPPVDMTDLPELPEGWAWASAEALCNPKRPITYGVIKLGNDTPNGVPTLRSSNVRHLRLDIGYVKQVAHSIAKNYNRTFLEGGEIVVTVRGTLGGVVVVPDVCKGFNISREVAMLALMEPRMANCLQFAMGSRCVQNWLLRRTKGIAYTGINIETLKQTPLPVAPLQEQQQIVAEIERRFTIADHVEQTIEQSLKQSRRLRQSILKRAFSGRLVPQDPNDEPAGKLLERIKAERTKDDSRRPARGRRPNRKERNEG